MSRRTAIDWLRIQSDLRCVEELVVERTTVVEVFQELDDCHNALARFAPENEKLRHERDHLLWLLSYLFEACGTTDDLKLGTLAPNAGEACAADIVKKVREATASGRMP